MTSILPTHGSSFYDGGKRGKHGPTFLRRLFRIPHMDFEFALWQMGYLLIAPRRVYRNIYYHKQTKNQWSRDDPAFILLQMILLSVSSIVWSFVYDLSVYGTIKTLLSMILVEFLLVGSVISTFTWCITNKFLTQNINSYAIAQKVEWAYAFDVHCNSFLPVYIILYIVQLFFLPLLLKDNWISLFIGNSMYCISLIWYMTGTFMGFNALPFLVHTELLLYPIALCIALFIASLFGFNISQYILAHYFQ
ncbi:UNC-50-like protein [Thamnidium elegans]|nr:UNC-50-like protein [Thamnidium elegans]